MSENNNNCFYCKKLEIRRRRPWCGTSGHFIDEIGGDDWQHEMETGACSSFKGAPQSCSDCVYLGYRDMTDDDDGEIIEDCAYCSLEDAFVTQYDYNITTPDWCEYNIMCRYQVLQIKPGAPESVSHLILKMQEPYWKVRRLG